MSQNKCKIKCEYEHVRKGSKGLQHAGLSSTHATSRCVSNISLYEIQLWRCLIHCQHSQQFLGDHHVDISHFSKIKKNLVNATYFSEMFHYLRKENLRILHWMAAVLFPSHILYWCHSMMFIVSSMKICQLMYAHAIYISCRCVCNMLWYKFQVSAYCYFQFS
jgi:hypothetical protein